MNWSDTPPDWTSPIGEKIDRFLQAVADRFPGYADTIVVFGSATIHLRLDPDFTSADADLRVSVDDENYAPASSGCLGGKAASFAETRAGRHRA